MHCLLPKDLTNQNLLTFSAAGVVPCGGPCIIIVQIIFPGPLGSLSSFNSYFENRVLIKPVLGGVAGVAYFITGHEHTQLNRFCYLHFFGVFPASKGSGSEVIKLFSCSTQLSMKS